MHILWYPELFFRTKSSQERHARSMMKAWERNSFGKHAHPAMPGACTIPGPGGGAGVSKRGGIPDAVENSGMPSGVPMCGPSDYKKRRKAVGVPNFGNQSDMLEAEVRVRRFLDSGEPLNAAEKFFKSGEDALPSAPQLLEDLLTANEFCTAMRVATSLNNSGIFSEHDLVSCLLAMPRRARPKDGQAILEALVKATDWPTTERENCFSSAAESILLRFLQEGYDDHDYARCLHAICSSDAESATSEPILDSSAARLSPPQGFLHKPSCIDVLKDVRDDELFILEDAPRDSNRREASATPDLRAAQAVGNLQRPTKDPLSPFLNGGVFDATSLGLIARSPLAASKRAKKPKASGAIGLAAYGSSSSNDEEEQEDDEKDEDSSEA